MHFKTCSFAAIALLLSAGCADDQHADQLTDQPTGAQSTGAQGASQDDSSPAAEERYTHSITQETAYYTDGPQQGRPPDGSLQPGEKVTLIEESGSYSRVRTGQGIEAHVASDSLKKLP